MPTLKYSDTEINYTVRHSARARNWRIKVTPSNVEIVAPRRASQRTIDAIIRKKRDWIYKHWKKMNANLPNEKLVPPARYEHGANMPYRGELFPLMIDIKDIKKPYVFFSDVAFHVTLPSTLPIDAHDAAIKKYIKNWMVNQLRGDIERIFELYGKKLGKMPKNYRIKHQKL